MSKVITRTSKATLNKAMTNKENIDKENSVNERSEKEDITHVSSGTTMFFKIVFPTLWFTFLGLFTITILYSEWTGGTNLGMVAYVMPMVMISGAIFFYFTIMALKRVEISDSHIYVSNYFKTIRLPLAAVKDYSTMELGIFYLASISFVQKTTFGKRIVMLGSKTKWSIFREKMPKHSILGEETDVENTH